MTCLPHTSLHPAHSPADPFHKAVMATACKAFRLLAQRAYHDEEKLIPGATKKIAAACMAAHAHIANWLKAWLFCLQAALRAC